MKAIRTQAIVLRRTNYRESDRILLLLTPEGVVSALARSVRKEKSRLAGGIELFSVSDVTLHQGKGDMYTLTSARLVTHYEHIVKNYEGMMWLYGAMRHIAQAAQESDESGWFEVLSEVFFAYNSGMDERLVQSWFYVRYAELTGFALSLRRDVEGQVILPDARYKYDTIQRGLIADAEGVLEAEHIKLLRVLSSVSLRVVANIGGTDSVASECLYVARNHAAV